MRGKTVKSFSVPIAPHYPSTASQTVRPSLPALPTFCRGPFYLMEKSHWICGTNEFGDLCHVADIRGWGYLTGQGQALALSPEVALAAQEKTARFIVDAMNAAWEKLITPQQGAV